MNPAVPNFLIVGAPKAGTTSLYHYLDQHPAVYMSPIKEPCFFAPEVVDLTPRTRAVFDLDAAALAAYLDGPSRQKRDHGIVLGWPQYLKLFSHVRDETAVGEASVAYLASLGAPRAIRARIPDARIVMMLRNPVDRLFSRYHAAVAARTARSFAQWAADQDASDPSRKSGYGSIWPGRYAVHLQRYLDVFPSTQVRAYVYDDFVKAPGDVLRDLLGFLGVDPGFPIDTRERHNVSPSPRRWSLRLRGRPELDDRARAIAIYEQDIRTLERLIGRDLSEWRRI